MIAVIVGAGPSGLGCAEALLPHGRVIVVDRIPVTGGSAGWDDPEIRRRTHQLTKSAVQWRLGATAIRWTSSELLVLGPDGAESIRADHLFFAGGCRPRTSIECAVTGQRPAGVIPATVAEHLLSTRQQLWRQPAVLGSGPWADRLMHALDAAGTMSIRVLLDGVHEVVLDDHDRVTSLRVVTDSGERVISCDAVILADGAIPVRNIVGAIDDDAPGVVYIQPTPTGDVVQRVDAARRQAAAWIAAHQIAHQIGGSR